ncbi:MAG: 30S ribosomal protein S20 [Bdellovibrionales bacterium]
MANHKSAIKKARMSLRRNTINRKTLGEVRTIENKLKKTIAAKDKEEATKILAAYMSRIGKASRKGRIHASTASRRVSRLSKAISAIA